MLAALVLCATTQRTFSLSLLARTAPVTTRLHASAASRLADIEGITVNGARIASVDGLRGVVASVDLTAKAPLVEVSSELVLQVTNNREASPFPDFVSQSLW